MNKKRSPIPDFVLVLAGQMVKGAVSGIPYTLAARPNFFFFGDSITQAGSKVQNLLPELFSFLIRNRTGRFQATQLLGISAYTIPSS